MTDPASKRCHWSFPPPMEGMPWAFFLGPEAPRDGRGPTYGRWNMKAYRVVKWNCVFRLQDPDGLSGDFSYHVFVAVGSLEDVRTTLAALQKM